MRFRTLSAAAAGVIACACTAGDPAAPPTTPPRIGADGANLRPVAVQFTQGSQNSDGSIPLVVGMPAAANVLVERSRESVAEVPVVLRLFRGQTLLRVDTARTSGVLSKSVNPASPSVQFLISGTLVTDSLAWQVEVDPAQLVADSVRTDNQLPATPALLNIVPLPPLHVHFVPIVLAAHAGVTGDVSASNAEQYLAGVRALLPTGALTFSIGTPLTVQQSLGTPPDGGALNFWSSIVADVDIARLISTTRSSIWYGIVPAPTGFTRFTNGGYAYIPSDPAGTGGGTRSAVRSPASEPAECQPGSKRAAPGRGSKSPVGS